MCYSMAEIEEQELREAKEHAILYGRRQKIMNLNHFSLHLHRTERQICI